jgi:hypothetical protein
MSISDWVFVRGSECLRVRRSMAPARELVIQGPGNLRRIGSFPNERELRQFETELYMRLLHDGWSLERSLTN